MSNPQDNIQDSARFAEIERLMGDYFSYHIAPIMKSTQAYLNNRQAEEMREYSTSFAGMMSSMASAHIPGADPYQTLKVTGEWNSKTTEDYIVMCKEKLVGSEDIQKDLALMAGEWRSAVVAEIGRERYDELSKELGCDLAFAFVDYRVEQQMIDKLVKDRMPKSSAEYIIRKAGESSLFGLSQILNRTTLDDEIASKGEAGYKPSNIEKGTGAILGAVTDTIALGGVGTWGRFAKFVGVDITLTGASSLFEDKSTETLTVEDCISKGVFGSETNVFEDFRKEAIRINTGENDYIKEINETLNKKTPIFNFNNMSWNKTMSEQQGGWTMPFAIPITQREEKYKEVPMVVAPGKEEQYLQEMAHQAEKHKKQLETTADVAFSAQSVSQGTAEKQLSASYQDKDTAQNQTNENGWTGFLSNFGLDGFGDITKNLGYVLATLPDILVGLFTGKTKSFNMDNSLLPVASILAGMFVRNPILKMLLIGMGGANLINRAGHEALERRQNGNGYQAGTDGRQIQYRTYADEELSPRISNPILKGTCLIANIDRVPCTIQLPQTVVDAYHAGALPLNTLANAVLAKSDSMRNMASQNYEQGEQQTVVRTRGIQ